ncbi:hypothetical protein LVJ83_10530 [Uruburuella testudinis]|uniref:Lipoprotein n=1 Tax=Uruburuella testudinis TaxID=1282863 RepID=A0ABY4DQS5_9NEIS|nr:hypothetical protein [Uruburuella testudinis]UOO81385.1 hypothetical protein LVJ83_10530 [Uruburuella testudinis]
MKALIISILCSLLAACAHLSDGQTIQVYKHDGSRQCEGAGVLPETMQNELKGIRIYHAEKSRLEGVAFPAVCGGGTGSINVYTIDTQNQAEAEKRGFSVLNKPINPVSDGL